MRKRTGAVVTALELGVTAAVPMGTASAATFEHSWINVAVGGDRPGAPRDNVLPQQMVIDYVKVSKYNPDGTAGPSPTPTKASPSPTKASPSPAAGATSWAPYTSYTVGQVVTRNGVRYVCRQQHGSLPGWEPATTPALWLPA